jgi:hypothetical protein
MHSGIFRLVVILAVGLTLCSPIRASNWNGIEPFVTDLGDVHIKLGKPVKETDAGPIYNYAWGTVSVVVVTEQDIAARKFKDKFRGKVRGIVVELRASNLAPIALGLLSNPDYERQSASGKVHFVNQAQGITYQFINDKLTKIFYEGAGDMQRKARG